MAIIGKLENIEKHFQGNEYFELAKKYFLEAMNPNSETYARIHNLPENSYERYDLEQGLFAIEQKFHSKELSECFLESHIKYVDFQLVISGTEMMEHCHISKCNVKEKYNADKDLIILNDTNDTNKILLSHGDIAIYYPQDVHMGCQKYKDSLLCTKTVVKIPLDNLN